MYFNKIYQTCSKKLKHNKIDTILSHQCGAWLVFWKGSEMIFWCF